jgi:hypothetical protein
MLRIILIAIGILLVIGGFVTLNASGYGAAAAAQFFIGGGFLLFVLLVEARRYGANKKPSTGPWEATGERFIDPSSGKLTEVRYNPQTGDREYVQADSGDSTRSS